MALTAGSRIGPYEILSLLGVGGMGEVYLAHDTRLRRNVALKVLPAGSAADERARNRLLHEARSAAALDHPNICAIYEIGEERGHSFIALQYVEGETLAARMARKPLDVDEALTVATQVARALAEAHAHGIIHRDIKPQNVMLTPRGEAKVLDFGLAKSAAPTDGTDTLLTQTGAISGTVPYMSPEQVRGQAVDFRSDTFSFGALLYELLTHTRAFGASTAAETISAILTKEPAFAGQHSSPLSLELQRIIRRCLEKERDRRYHTTRDLVIDLEDAARQAGAHRYPSTLRRAIASRLVWIAAVGALVALGSVWAWRHAGGAPEGQPAIRSLAVLPLRSLNSGSADEALGLGIADTIITKVSQVGGLTVRPTSAVRKFVSQDIDSVAVARQLGVDSVLDGTLQRAGDRFRVSMNLLRVSDRASLWAETFDPRADDIFTMQDEISRQVAARLAVRLSAKDQARLARHDTSSPAAHEYYLRGMYTHDKWTGASSRADVETAIAMFKKAIEIDPDYALAHAQLAYGYTVMALFIEPESDWLERAREEMSRARSLDPDLAELHEIRSEVYFSAVDGYRFDEAIRELRLAEQLNPSVGHASLGVLFAHLGLEEPAYAQLHRALEIDPASERNQNRLAEAQIWFGKYDESIAGFERLITVDPGNPGLYTFLALPYLYQQRLGDAERVIARALTLKPTDPIALSDRALLAALKGDFGGAEAAVSPIVDKGKNLRSYHHAAYNIASIYALEGKVAEAVRWLRTTSEKGMPNYLLFARDHHLDRIRDAAPFVQFLAESKALWERYTREFR